MLPALPLGAGGSGVLVDVSCVIESLGCWVNTLSCVRSSWVDPSRKGMSGLN